MDRGIAEIRLLAESPAFDFQIYPQKMMVPKDQRVYFEVTMIPKPEIKSGNYPVTFRLVGGGREFKRFNLDIAGEKQLREQEKKEPQVPTSQVPPVQKKESVLLSVKKASQPPKIDGKFVEECWKNAGVCGNFCLKGQGKPVYQTTGLLAYDSTYLYLGFLCRDNEPEKITERDRIEIQVSPDISGKTYYSIVLMGNGKCTFGKTSQTGDIQYLNSGVLSYAIYRGVNSWMLEVAIPFSSLGVKVPEPGTKWSMKIIRTKATGYTEESFWAMDSSSYHQEKGFGQVVFAQ